MNDENVKIESTWTIYDGNKCILVVTYLQLIFNITHISEYVNNILTIIIQNDFSTASHPSQVQLSINSKK